MKLRITALTDQGTEALKQFLEETTRKKTVREKLTLASARAVGSIKAKEFTTHPFSLTVSFSAWKKIPKYMVNVSQIQEIVEKHWFPGLTWNADYKVKMI